jgi:cyclase
LNGETYSNFFELILDISKVSRMPISFGGGIETLRDIEERLRAGADKVCINSAAIENPEFIDHAVKEFGAQCIVVSIDYWSDKRGNFVYSHSKRKILDLDLLSWAKEMEDKGAGEILINDVLRDGQQSGYNLQASAQVSDLLKCPVISCGGAGNWMHMNELLENTNVDAVAAGNIFHFQDQSVYLARKTLFEAGRQVRPPSLYIQ